MLRTPQLPGLDKSRDPGDSTSLRVTGTGARQGGLECPCQYPLPRIPKFANTSTLSPRLAPHPAPGASILRRRHPAGTRPESRSCRDCQAAPNPGRGRLVRSSGLRLWGRREGEHGIPDRRGAGMSVGDPRHGGRGRGGARGSGFTVGT